MDKKISDYVKALSSNDFDVLEEIFLKKYRKFLRCYYIISDYSDQITYLSYDKLKDDNKLRISFTVSGKSKTVDKIMSEIAKSVKGSDDVLIYNQKKTITVEITQDESELP